MDDILARLGGDEFVMVLPKTDAQGAEAVIQRIKDLLTNEKVGAFDLSVSFGYEIKRQEDEGVQILSILVSMALSTMYQSLVPGWLCMAMAR